MTTLRERLDEYLELRRSLGFQLNDLERQVGFVLHLARSSQPDKDFHHR